MKLRQAQAGIGGPTVLLVAVMVTLLAGASYYVLTRNQEPAITKKSVTPATSQNASTENQTTSAGKLVINEFGFNVEKTSEIADITYEVLSENSAGQTSAISIQTGALRPLLKACFPDEDFPTVAKDFLMTVTKTPGMYDADSMAGVLLKQFDNFYLSYGYESEDCAGTEVADAREEYIEKANMMKAAVVEAFKNLEQQ